jgi:hypothetical protein
MAVAHSRYYPGIYLMQLKKQENLSQATRSPCLNSNPEPREYETGLVERVTFLKMEAIYSFETSFNFHRATWRYITEDITVYIREI